jgi:predicted PurR-regulated permease PerM
VIGIASRGVSMAFNLATVAMFAFYFTADAPRLQRTVLSLFEPGVQERVGWTLDQAIVQTGGYFYSRLLLMTINGIGFLIATAAVGMPLSLAVPLALFAGFVGAFLPMIGAFLGSAVASIVTLAVQGLPAAVGVLAYAIVYQMIENAWLAPKISANTMTLSGGVAFGAVLVGGAIAGPMGAFVSLPVAALITSMITNYARSYEVVYRSEFDRGGEESRGAPR